MSSNVPTGPNWGNSRPHRGYAQADPADSRFAIGLSVFLIVALIYPWYSYWVQTRLLASDAEAAVRQLEQQSAAMSARWQAQATAASARQRERDQRRRIAGVTVRGISEGSDATVVIVDFGDASVAESVDAICDHVQRTRGAGTHARLQVQRFRGAAPAVPVGSIQCAR